MHKFLEETSLVNLAKFEKGIEVGSSNYLEKNIAGTIPYIRVGDLTNKTNTFIFENVSNKKVIAYDILIAFDGAPGRVSCGLTGVYSSGLYKIKTDDDYVGLIYFELKSKKNQLIIKDYSQGTTILHASKSIPFLKGHLVKREDLMFLNSLYNLIVKSKLEIRKLQNIKQNLLCKYF